MRARARNYSFAYCLLLAVGAAACAGNPFTSLNESEAGAIEGKPAEASVLPIDGGRQESAESVAQTNTGERRDAAAVASPEAGIDLETARDAAVPSLGNPADSAGPPITPPRADAGSLVEAGKPDPDLPTCAASEEEGPLGRCYYFSNDRLRWSQAREACLSRGEGWDLVSIENEQEDAFVSSSLDRDSWLGGVRVENTWIWVSTALAFWHGDEDGVTANDAYIRWAQNEPSDGDSGGRCLRHSIESGNWYWANIPCDRTYGFVCEQTVATDQAGAQNHELGRSLGLRGRG